jgi:hypothetical protein
MLSQGTACFRGELLKDVTHEWMLCGISMPFLGRLKGGNGKGKSESF